MYYSPEATKTRRELRKELQSTAMQINNNQNSNQYRGKAVEMSEKSETKQKMQNFLEGKEIAESRNRSSRKIKKSS